MADKKVSSAVREKDDQILKLQRRIDEMLIQLTKKEKLVLAVSAVYYA